MQQSGEIRRMTSGQKSLANLLELTSVATKSLQQPTSQLENELQDIFRSQGKKTSHSDEIIFKENSSGIETSSGQSPTVAHYQSLPFQRKKKEGSKPVAESEENCSKYETSSDAESYLTGTSGKSTAVNISKKLPIKTSSDSTNTSCSSTEVKTPPEPSDQMKSGVFVSSIATAFTDRAIKPSFSDAKPAQVTSCNPLISTSKVSKTLIQGDEDLRNSKLVSTSGNEVVATSYPEGQKKNVLQEKFKRRLLNAGPMKKRVMPIMVHVNATKSQTNQLPENSTNENAQKSATAMSSSAENAVSYASIATSAAIAPFLQIQNALESQIASLVSSVSLAHSAKDEMQNSKQEKQMAYFSKRMSQLEELQTETLKQQVSIAARARESQSMVDVSRHDNASSVCFPTQNIKSDNDLQMIPTRDQGPNIQNTKTPPRSDQVASSLVNQRQNIAKFAQFNNFPAKQMPSNRQMLQLDVPDPKRTSQPLQADKSTSPFFQQFIAKTKSSKTQTSSAESSILSEESLLETPLPRSKIPVPFSRYTPKNDKRKNKTATVGTKRLVSQPTRNDSQSLLESKKQTRNRIISEKENVSPQLSDRRSLNERLQENLQKNISKDSHIKYCEIDRLDTIKAGMKDIQKEATKIKEKLSSLEEQKIQPLAGLTKPSNLDFNKEIAPIDDYLVFPIRGEIPYLSKSSTSEKERFGKDKVETFGIKGQSGRGHHIEASRILEEIQQSRNRLENNLESVVRHSEQNRLYNFIDHHQQQQRDGAAESQRIRLDVDKRIEEIASQVKQELLAVGKETHAKPQSEIAIGKKETKKVVSKERGKAYKAKSVAPQKTHAPKSKIKAGNKDKLKKNIDVEKTEELELQPLARLLQPSHLDEELLARLCGKPTYNAHRTSIRPPHIQFHSPPKIPREQAKRRPTKQAVQRTPKSAKHQIVSRQTETREAQNEGKIKYYFQHCDPHLPYEHKEAYYPSSGDLVPMAVSLGKPRQDSSLRLPIPSEDMAPEKKILDLKRRKNVGVVEIRAEEMHADEKEGFSKRTKNLIIQNLPNVDIQTPSSEAPQNRFVLQEMRHSSPKSQDDSPIPSPNQEEFANFQNYITTNEFDGEEEAEIEGNKVKAEEEQGLHFDGIQETGPKQYNQPPFPPQQPRYENEPSTVEIQSRLSLEEKAQEWIEQELLAIIISQMKMPKDPTLAMPVDRSVDAEKSCTSSDEEEEHNWIHDIIGPSGLQLFVDAGLPINNEIITHLVRDVIAERLKILLGHPNQSTPQREEIIHEEHQHSPLPPSNVSTPIQTPIYTPIQSSASSIRTPLLSTVSPDSSEEAVFSLQEEKDKTTLENDDLIETNRDSAMPTPPQTPVMTKNFSRLDEHVETPLPSLKEDEHQTARSLALTPEASDLNESGKTQSEFVISGSIVEAAETPTTSPPPSLRLQTPPRPVVNVIAKSASPSFTLSSTTTATMRSSLFSEGEHLCPDSVIPGLYSEGEYPVSEGMAVLPPVDELDEDVKTNFKQLLQNVIGKPQRRKINGFSDTATLKETEDIEEDTLEEISISEGEFLANEDPVIQLLNQIKSPPGDRGLTSNQEKSEGEVSIGENEKEIKNQKVSPFKHLNINQTRELKRKDLSTGEMTSVSNNGARLPSYSVGEVRNVSVADEERSSKADLSSNSALFNDKVGRSADNSAAQSDRRPRDDEHGNETVAMVRDDLENTVNKPRAILVQSRDFDNTSTFNYTDSLNETKFGTLKDFELGTLNEQQIEEAMENAEEKEFGYQTDNYQTVDEEKIPTKITLMIPSVADEDSADEVTLEGDVNSYEDEVTFSGDG